MDNEDEETEARREQRQRRSRIGGVDTKSNPVRGGHEAEAMPNPLWVHLGPPIFEKVTILWLLVSQVVFRQIICG